MDIMLKWIAYVILSAAETWIGYRLFNTYLTRNSVRQRYYWLGVIFYFTFQMFSYVNESPMFSTAAYYFFFATIIAVVFFSDSLQNKITIALLFVIMNYACKTAMTGIALAWGEQTLPRELINYRIVMDPWSQMMACILFVLSLWGTICIRELRLNKQNLLYAVISYLFPLTVMISVIIISHKNIGFGSAGTYQDYYVDVKTAGLYDLKVNYSHDCASDTKAIAMRVDGNTTTQLGEVTLKNTGGWANYQDSDTIEIRLEAGKQFIRIYDDIDGFNYRHVQLTFKGKQDVTQPEITGKDAIVCVGDETDIKDLLELKATDDIDGDLSDKLTISGDYDCHQVGIYIITVTVSDQAGNEATKLFKIKVVEKAKLVVDAKEFIVGDEFDPLTGVKVYDVDGTNITEKLTVVSNNVNVNKAGTYQVTYRVVDALGNEVEFTREVIVKKVKTDVEPSNPDVPSVSKPNDSSSDNQLSSSNGGQETIVGQVVKSTKTGDNTQLVTMMSMLLLAGIGFIVLKRRKYNH